MVAIAFPLTSSPGEKPQESAGRLRNAYAEKLGPGAPAEAVIKRAPGLSNFAETEGEETFRGMIEVEDTLYAAFDGAVVAIDDEGTVEAFDDLLGTDPIFLARNNNATPDIVGVSPANGAFIIDPDGPEVAEYPDEDLPSPNSVCFGLGFLFFTIGDGRCFASGVNTTGINTQDTTTAEAKPDTLYRGWFWGDQLYLGGPQSIEVWGPPVNDTGFPFNRITVIPRGLASNRAVTGFEDGFEHGIVFAAQNSIVYMLKNYDPVRISTPDVERDISRLADKSAIEMTSYIVDGHPHIKISCPAWTWVYDLSAQVWHERTSYLQLRWRLTQAYWAFGKWVAGDKLSGNIVQVRADVYTEAGTPLIFEVESAPGQAFPHRIAIPRADFNFISGTGIASGLDPIETDPQVQIAWCDDGATFSTPLVRSIGRQSVHRPITVTRTGQTGQKGRKWKLTVSDRVYVGLLGGDMKTIARAA